MERCHILQETSEIDPYSLFLFSLKSKESRSKYAQRINRFFDIIEIPAGETADRCKVFFQNGQEDSKYVLNHVILFLQAQKEKVENKKLASGTVRNYVNTIKLVCEVCEFTIPWKKILRGLPRGRRLERQWYWMTGNWTNPRQPMMIFLIRSDFLYATMSLQRISDH